jgi:hypothetical protein
MSNFRSLALPKIRSSREREANMHRLSNHGLLAPLAPIVAPLLINGWFGCANLRQMRRSSLTASRNPRRHCQRWPLSEALPGRALITGLIAPAGSQ